MFKARPINKKLIEVLKEKVKEIKVEKEITKDNK